MFEDQSISIPCPKCGHETAKLIGDLKRNHEFACGGCGRMIDADPTALIDQLENAIGKGKTRLGRTIRRLNKR